jgi:hypothetical protein
MGAATALSPLVFDLNWFDLKRSQAKKNPRTVSGAGAESFGVSLDGRRTRANNEPEDRNESNKEIRGHARAVAVSN